MPPAVAMQQGLRFIGQAADSRADAGIPRAVQLIQSATATELTTSGTVGTKLHFVA